MVLQILKKAAILKHLKQCCPFNELNRESALKNLRTTFWTPTHSLTLKHKRTLALLAHPTWVAMEKRFSGEIGRKTRDLN